MEFARIPVKFGFLCIFGSIGICYIFYKYSWLSRAIDVEQTKERTSNNNNRARASMEAVSDKIIARREKVKTIENRCFIAIHKMLPLTCDQVDRLKCSAEIPEDTGDYIETLQQFLTEIRERGILTPPNYYYILENLFKKAEIEMNEKIKKHLNLLAQAVFDLYSITDEGDTERNKYDICLMYCDEDTSSAIELENSLKLHAYLDPPLTVIHQDELNSGRGELSALEDVFNRAIYVFIIVSPRLAEDFMKRFSGENVFLKSLRKEETRWRVIPIWMEKGLKESDSCPFELSGLQGIKYYNYLEDNQNTRIFKQIENNLIKDRKRVED